MEMVNLSLGSQGRPAQLSEKGKLEDAGIEKAKEFLKSHYDLEIDDNILSKILSFKEIPRVNF